jgi:hypothetical protein
VLAAAQRVFGCGDPIVLALRACDLAAAPAVPIAARDLALLNWARRADQTGAGRIAGGWEGGGDPDARALAAEQLGLAPERPHAADGEDGAAAGAEDGAAAGAGDGAAADAG